PAETAPEEARHASDKNRRVEREQRARRTDVVPSGGRPKPRSPERAGEGKETKPLPKLSHLGVPYAPAAEPERSTRADDADRPFRDEALVDEDQLPVGGENLLNTQESVFFGYFARMKEALGPQWN